MRCSESLYPGSSCPIAHDRAKRSSKMRLLDTKTARLEVFHDPARIPPYAIFSHVWQEAEQTFQDIERLASHQRPRAYASRKIRRCCMFAEREGFDWIWIDTCCIDKSSSSELSEAINSMYAWYAGAAICYVYMYDVEDTHPSRGPSFRQSVWFNRGWTLQELLAPSYVVFLSKEWHTLGTKQTLAHLIMEITGIPESVLLHEQEVHQISVAQRMAWAATRRTTREEDRAYSLMGIFDVHMPTIYGEGSHAFLRLQLEILKRSDDQSIFAWGSSSIDYKMLSGATPVMVVRDVELQDPALRTLLATSPSDFIGAGDIVPITPDVFGDLIGHSDLVPPQFDHTNQGMSTTLPIVTLQYRQPLVFFSILACQDSDENLIILFLHQPLRTSNKYYQHYVGADLALTSSGSPHPSATFYRVGRITRGDLIALRDRIILQSLFIHLLPQPTPPRSRIRSVSTSRTHAPVSYGFFFPAWMFRWGHIVLATDQGSQSVDDGDGYMLEVGPACPERTIVLARDISFGHQEDAPEGFRFSVMSKCPCYRGPLQHPFSFTIDMISSNSLSSPATSTVSGHSRRESGHGRQRSLSFMLERDRTFVQMILQTTSSPTRGPSESLPRSASGDHSTDALASHSEHSEWSWKGWLCEKKRVHIPTISEPNILLKFCNDAGSMAFSLKRWEGCHRSDATYVYIVDFELVPHGREPERKGSLPTYTQGVIPDSGLILYQPLPSDSTTPQRANSLHLEAVSFANDAHAQAMSTRMIISGTSPYITPSLVLVS